MGTLTVSQIWAYRAAYVVLGLVLIATKLLPLNFSGGMIPGPDLLLAFTFAWLVRQPSIVPLGCIVLVFLLADFLLQRPPGLWALLGVLASESLRRRRLTMSEFPFLVEWGAVASAVMGMTLINRLVLWILMVDLPAFGLSLAHAITTILVYPPVVLVSYIVFRLRKPGLSELD